GIFMAAVWGVADVLLRTPWPRALGAGAALSVLIPLGAVAHRQAARWHDSLTLFAYTVEISPAAIPQVHYANALQGQGRVDEAIAHYEAALALKPDFEPALISLGNALLRLGRVREAIPRFATAVAAHPSSELAQLGMGNAWLAAGDLDSALAAFRRAIEISPERAEAHNSAGVALARRGDVAAALPYFEEALRLRPDLADARRNLETARQTLAKASADRAARGVSDPR